MASIAEALRAKKRKANGTRACRLLRQQGEVPAVVYGHKEEPLPVQVRQDDLETALRRHSRMFELKIGRKKDQVLLKAVQYDAFGTEIIHADFLRVALDETIALPVPVELKGTPKQEHAVLQQTLNAVQIECLPTNIPEVVIGHVGNMQIGESLNVSHLEVPEDVKVLTDPETVVASLTATAAEAALEAEEEVETAASEEPEIIGRAKPEGTEQETEAGG